MNYMDCGYDTQRSFDASMNNPSNNQQSYASGDAKDGETCISESRISMMDSSSINMHFPHSTVGSHSGSNFLLPSNPNSCYLQAGLDIMGGNNHSDSFSMPRTVNWSETTPRRQMVSDLVRNGQDDASNVGPGVTASPSVLMSARGVSNRTKNSSFDTSFEMFASRNGNNGNNALCYGEAIVNSGTNDSNSEVIKSLNLRLQVKETQNESLESEIQKLKKTFNEALNFKQSEHKFEKQNSHAGSTPIEVPTSVEQVFKKLSSSLEKKDKELEETKQTLESVLTALALNPTNSVTKYGRYDAEALAHKMVVRLETLTKENQEMAKMLAYGRAKEVQIELQLARMENRELKDTVSKLKQSNET